VTVSSWRRVDDNIIPARGKIAGAYVNSAFVKTDANRAGFDEALVLNQDGHISEGSAANVFMLRKGVWATPPITDNILEGITRRSIIQFMREDLKWDVVERSIDRTEVYLADEMFFAGTGVQIAAITKVDHRNVGTGQMALRPQNSRSSSSKSSAATIRSIGSGAIRFTRRPQSEGSAAGRDTGTVEFRKLKGLDRFVEFGQLLLF
jgi:branched-subunit amino acid aminotransferase/4-amino-4-deoxychorismate lyase